MNIVRAVFDGAEKLLDAKTVAQNRGKSIKETVGIIWQRFRSPGSEHYPPKPAKRVPYLPGLRKIGSSNILEATPAVLGW
jgi:ribosomal protein L30/L7E